MKLSKLEQRITYSIIAIAALVILGILYAFVARPLRMNRLNQRYFSEHHLSLSLSTPYGNIGQLGVGRDLFDKPFNTNFSYSSLVGMQIASYRQDGLEHRWQGQHLGIMLIPNWAVSFDNWEDFINESGGVSIDYPGSSNLPLHLMPVSLAPQSWRNADGEIFSLDASARARQRPRRIDLYESGMRLTLMMNESYYKRIIDDEDLDVESTVAILMPKLRSDLFFALQDGQLVSVEERVDLGEFIASYPLHEVQMPPKWAALADSIITPLVAHANSLNTMEQTNALPSMLAVQNIQRQISREGPRQVGSIAQALSSPTAMLQDAEGNLIVAGITGIGKHDNLIYLQTLSGRFSLEPVSGDIRIVDTIPMKLTKV
jgi:hypothetical protein